MTADTHVPNSDNVPRAPGGDSPRVAPTGSGRDRARVYTWGATGALFALSIALITVAATRKPPPLAETPALRANVETVRVVAAPYDATLVLPAKIEAERRALISFEVPGRLDKWLVKEGDKVAATQPLAVLNTDMLKVQLAQMQARRESALKSVAVNEQQLALARVALERAQKEAATVQLDLAAAQSDLDLAQKEYARVKPLAECEVVTKSDLDAAENALTQRGLAVKRVRDAIDRAAMAVESARLSITQAEAALAMGKAQAAEAEEGIAAANLSLAKSELHAPFAGWFEKYLVEPGDVVSAGQPIAHMYDIAFLRARVDVADRYVAFLEAGNPTLKEYIALALPGTEQRLRASILLPGLPKLTGGTYKGLELEATIVRVGQASDPTSNTFEVELRFANPGEALKEGMIAQAHIDYLRYPNAITIPLRAIQVSDVGPRVLVVETRKGATSKDAAGNETAGRDRDVAAVRDIEPVSIKGDTVLVSRGLAAGERLIVAGGKGVMNGEEVNVIVEDGALAAGAPQAPAP